MRGVSCRDVLFHLFFFFSSRRRHTRSLCDWSSDVCSSDLDKRGLAAGITAAGFGAGSALTVAPIQAMIQDSGFQSTFLYFGLGQGLVIVILAFFLFAPKAGQVPVIVQNANLLQTRRNYQPPEVIRH